MNAPGKAIKVTNIQNIVEGQIHKKQQYLMNRTALGIPMREQLSKWIKENRDSDVIFILDFEGILEASSSVADEIGPIFFREFLDHREKVSNRLGELFLVYGNLSAELAESLERTFSGWSRAYPSETLMVAVGYKMIHDGEFQGYYFLGRPQLPSKLAEILDLIYINGDMTSYELEQKGVVAPSRKLNEVNERCPWLVRKTRVRLEETEKGWTYVYSPILPPQNPVSGEVR